MDVDQEVKGDEILEANNGGCCPADDCGLGYLIGIEKAIEIINKANKLNK